MSAIVLSFYMQRPDIPPCVRQPDSQMDVEQLCNLKYAGSGQEPDNQQT